MFGSSSSRGTKKRRPESSPPTVSAKRLEERVVEWLENEAEYSAALPSLADIKMLCEGGPGRDAFTFLVENTCSRKRAEFIHKQLLVKEMLDPKQEQKIQALDTKWQRIATERALVAQENLELQKEIDQLMLEIENEERRVKQSEQTNNKADQRAKLQHAHSKKLQHDFEMFDKFSDKICEESKAISRSSFVKSDFGGNIAANTQSQEIVRCTTDSIAQSLLQRRNDSNHATAFSKIERSLDSDPVTQKNLEEACHFVTQGELIDCLTKLIQDDIVDIERQSKEMLGDSQTIFGDGKTNDALESLKRAIRESKNRHIKNHNEEVKARKRIDEYKEQFTNLMQERADQLKNGHTTSEEAELILNHERMTLETSAKEAKVDRAKQIIGELTNEISRKRQEFSDLEEKRTEIKKLKDFQEQNKRFLAELMTRCEEMLTAFCDQQKTSETFRREHIVLGIKATEVMGKWKTQIEKELEALSTIQLEIIPPEEISKLYSKEQILPLSAMDTTHSCSLPSQNHSKTFANTQFPNYKSIEDFTTHVVRGIKNHEMAEVEHEHSESLAHKIAGVGSITEDAQVLSDNLKKLDRSYAEKSSGAISIISQADTQVEKLKSLQTSFGNEIDNELRRYKQQHSRPDI